MIDFKDLKGVIVVEGPDCSGKSTLCNQLAELSGGKVIHMTYRFKNNMFEYNTAVLRQTAKLSKEKLVILDRSYLSEIVYAKVFRNGGRWPLIDRFIEPVLASLNYMGIYCDPYDGDIEKQVSAHSAAQDPDHPYNDSNYRKVVETYRYEMSVRSQFKKWFFYNYHEDTAAGMLTRFAGHVVGAATVDENCTGRLRNSRLLLVGEQVNCKYRQKILWPFHEYANSSLWLHQRLDNAGISSDRCCFMNALVDGKEQGTQLFSRMISNPIAILPLGKAAEDLVKKTSSRVLSAKIVPEIYWPGHPQYVKRFGGVVGAKDYEDKLRNAYNWTFQN